MLASLSWLVRSPARASFPPPTGVRHDDLDRLPRPPYEARLYHWAGGLVLVTVDGIGATVAQNSAHARERAVHLIRRMRPADVDPDVQITDDRLTP